jgi:hypothetical protein
MNRWWYKSRPEKLEHTHRWIRYIFIAETGYEGSSPLLASIHELDEESNSCMQ